MAQATVNLASFADKLRRLESTPQSITALSKYVVYQCKGASAAANVRAMATTWLAEVTAATGDMQLVYVYLVNDVLQSSRHERPPTPALLAQGWLRVLPRALAVIGTRSLAVVPKVRRTLNVWKERGEPPSGHCTGGAHAWMVRVLVLACALVRRLGVVSLGLVCGSPTLSAPPARPPCSRLPARDAADARERARGP